MNSVDEIFSLITTLDREEKKLFYFKLGFNLTISIRSFSHDPRYDDHEILEGLKNINELSHRNFNWLWQLIHSKEETDEMFMFEVVKDYCKIHPKSSGEIKEAVRSSYHDLVRAGVINKNA